MNKSRISKKGHGGRIYAPQVVFHEFYECSTFLLVVYEVFTDLRYIAASKRTADLTLVQI